MQHSYKFSGVKHFTHVHCLYAQGLPSTCDMRKRGHGQLLKAMNASVDYLPNIAFHPLPVSRTSKTCEYFKFYLTT